MLVNNANIKKTSNFVVTDTILVFLKANVVDSHLGDQLREVS